MSRTGNRLALPAQADKVCAACGAKRGNVRKGWSQIVRLDQVVGWTCPECPRADEPIRRTVTGRGAVRFRAVVDATPAGASKRKQASKVCASLDDARAFVEQVRAEVSAAGEYAPAPSVTVDALCEQWLASRVDVRAVTVEGYRAVLAPVRRKLGDRAVESITRADIGALVPWLSEHGGKVSKAHPQGRPLSPRTVRGSLVALGQVWDLAVSYGHATENIVRGVKPPRQARRLGSDLEHWSPDELIRFRGHADGDRLAAAWRLTLCGMTRADVLGLRWSDVNMNAGTVAVSQGRVQLQYGGQRAHVDAPKSPQRRRTVPVEVIHPGSMALLRTMRAQQMRERMVAGGAWHDSGLVVVDELGVPMRPERYSDVFRTLCVSAKVPTIRLHSVRHSLAFWLHHVGVAPANAAAFLGHTVEVHLGTYLPDSGDAGIEAAAQALAAAQMSQQAV
ncbi:site-specific integrase [Brachybacterium tyrofermentans]|uniref:site-specific integrase n=1 Tax=Brachybacterium tyrofermentans TaxID=47848 RepID=UPI003FD18D3F